MGKVVLATKADVAERDRRWKRAREAMAKAGMDALLVAGNGAWPGRVQYFTNYRTNWHHALFLLPLSKEPAMTFSSDAIASRIARMGWVSDVRGGFNVHDVLLDQRMVDAMKERGLARGTVGVAGMEWILPYGTYQKLRETLPNVNLVNADEMVDRIRMAKTPLEVQQIRETHALVRAVMERFVEALEPGKTEVEVVNEALQVAYEGGAASASARIGEALGDPRNVPIKGEGTIRLYPNAVGPNGYMNEQMLVCTFREPTALEEKLMESELQAYAEIRKMRPGARLSDWAKAFDRIMRGEGWSWGRPRTGYDFHGIGMDNVERPCYAEVMNENPQLWQASQDWALEEGAVINYHQRRNYTALGGGQITELAGTGINEDILITPHGAERLLGEDWDLHWRRMDR